jgi:broad specificity phosphatase PhoE
LSEKGLQQVELLEEFCKKNKFYEALNIKSFDDWILISSPMRRCLLTTRALANSLQKQCYVHPKLYESGGCYGVNENKVQVVYPGSTAEEVEREFPNYKCFSGMEQGWYYGSCDHVESWSEFQTRAQIIVDWIWSMHCTPVETRNFEGIHFKNMIFVIHGNLLSAVISGLQNAKGLITHNNTGHTHVQLLTGKNHRKIAAIKYMNRVDHIHLRLDNQFITGNDTINDHWIQEYQKED